MPQPLPFPARGKGSVCDQTSMPIGFSIRLLKAANIGKSASLTRENPKSTSTTGFPVAANVVVADDDTTLQVLQSSGTTLVLDTAPSAFVAPGSIAAYAGSTTVLDLRPAAGSALLQAGITPVGVTAPDAGPFGAAAGGAPGNREPIAADTLRLLGAAPALANGVTSAQALVLTFDRPIDAASVTADRVVALQNGSAAAVNLSTNGATLTIAPTGAGWSGTVSLRLLAGLRGTDGSLLAAPLQAPLRLL